MPIKWSALALNEAADSIEAQVYQAAVPLQRAKELAQEARRIPGLPQYIEVRLVGLIVEIERAIGGGGLDGKGRLRAHVEGIRGSIPSGAIEAERARQSHGVQRSLI